MNTLLSTIRLLIIVIVISQSSPTKASSPALTGPQLAKIKAAYITVRTIDVKTMKALRNAINNTTNRDLEYASNEALLSAAAKTFNELSRLSHYTYQNGINKDVLADTAWKCLFDIEYKYRELAEKVFDDEMYLLDPVDDAEQIEDEIFASSSAKSQLETCGKLETALGL
jgi:hypothetical protein